MFKKYPLCSSVDECLYADKYATAPPMLDNYTAYNYNDTSFTGNLSFTVTIDNDDDTTIYYGSSTTGTSPAAFTGNMTASGWPDLITTVANPSYPVVLGAPNTALLTLMLILFTFIIAYTLKGLRNKKLLGRTVSINALSISTS